MAINGNFLQLTNDERKLHSKVWSFWGSIDDKILEKFKNLNGKTGRYDVPHELFQRRTSRSNRVLIRWKIIDNNKIKLYHLKTFYGGICVELVNHDYFKKSNNKLLNTLKKDVGSNNIISSMISLRNEAGISNSSLQRDIFNKQKIIKNIKYPIIERDSKIGYKGKGDNSVWKGKIYYSIRGGEQNSIESHPNSPFPTLFNPAVEYANERVCFDIDMTMSYFALHCNDIKKEKEEIDSLKREIEEYLKNRKYKETKLKTNKTTKETTLLDYCKNHYSLKFGNGILIDPIQLDEMLIEDFKTSNTKNSAVVSHNESADKSIFYFEENEKFILSPARPTNLFWSKHHSNMMQQDLTLIDYFEAEENRYKKRKILKSKNI